MLYRDIPLESLLLDAANPRLPETTGQREIVASHLAKEPRKLLTLARDVVSEGGLSPIDLPYVMKQGTSYVVVEGNRRIAALKLLVHPDLANSATVRDQYKRLATGAELPSEVHCAIASSREDARHWIILRHTGENEGAGVVPWDTAMRERFNRTSGTQAGRALVLLDDLQAAFADDTSLAALIDGVRDRQLTVLGRFVSDPDVRNRMGLEFGADSLISHYTSSQLRPAVKRLLDDITSGTITSRSLNAKSQRADYLSDLAVDLPDEAERSNEAVPLGPPTKGTSSTSGGRKKRKAKPKVPLLFGDLSLAQFPDKIGDILYEMQKLDIERFPYAVSALMRVLIELCVAEIYEVHSWQEAKLKESIRKCMHLVDTTDKDNRLAAVRTGLSDGYSLFAARSLQAYLHNVNYHASPTDLKAIAQNYQYLLQKLNDHLGELDAT